MKHSVGKGEYHEPKEWAAGTPAVVSSLKQVMSTAGPLRGTKALLKLNQKKGFDCPSCAWPDPDDHRAVTEFCENGAKAIASEATSRKITADFFRQNSITSLLEESDYWHDQQGRLTEPMYREAGSDYYTPLNWNEVFPLIAKKLKELEDPNEAVFYTSGRASNEAAFLYQLLVRSFGTNNLPDCSNMCHESSGSALNAAIGIGKGTVSLDDLHQADVILSVGQNPGTNHPRMLSSLETCIDNGGEVIAINPLKEAGLMGFAHPQRIKGILGKFSPLASQYYQVNINGDMALFRGIAKSLLERESQSPGKVLDHDFIDEHTIGFDEYEDQCEQSSWAEIEKMSGIAKEGIEKIVDSLLKKKRRFITCWAMGLTQQHNAVDTIREVTNVHLMLGALGREGAGVCPVRGHSNVQGDRTMGIYEKVPESFHKALEKAYSFSSPREHGYDVVDSIEAMQQGKVKVFMALGGNFLQAAPDTGYTAEALAKCDLTIQISTKLNRSHLMTGKSALILPCLGRSETDLQASGPQSVTCENSMGIVHQSEGSLKPASSELLSEPAIICRTAKALFGESHHADWSSYENNYDEIRNVIEKVIPGFEDFNQRVREPGGFYLPNDVKNRVWKTESGKAHFSASVISCFKTQRAERLVLQTLRSHDQYNTTVYGLDDRYRGVGQERMVLFMNPDDMKARALAPAAKVVVTSYWKAEERVLSGLHAIPYDMPRGATAAYFPEANVLVPIGSTAAISNTPTSKAIEISVVAADLNK